MGDNLNYNRESGLFAFLNRLNNAARYLLLATSLMYFVCAVLLFTYLYLSFYFNFARVDAQTAKIIFEYPFRGEFLGVPIALIAAYLLLKKYPNIFVILIFLLSMLLGFAIGEMTVGLSASFINSNLKKVDM